MKIQKRLMSLDTILGLPKEIVVYHCDEDVVVVSPQTANWLVVSRAQLEIYNLLKSGLTIGAVISISENKNIVMSLLKQILARDFREKKLAISDRNDKALFYLTYDCNLCCDHCYMYAQKQKEKLLTCEEYGEIFKALIENGIKEVTFSGGEPLMRSDFWCIVKKAADVGMFIKVFSNGTLWTNADIENAKRFFVKVQISIDGIDEESCSVVRGVGVFSKARQTAIQLVKAGVDVEIATTPTNANLKTVELNYHEFVDRMRREAGNNLKFKISLNLMPGRNIKAMTSDEKQEYEARGSRLYSIANPDGVKIPFFEEFMNKQGRLVCGLGRLVFTPDGFIHICSRLDYLQSLGNIREGTVVQMINAAKNIVAAASVDNTIPCRDCPLRYICGGGCRAERYEYVSNSIDKPSTHKPCAESQKMALVKMMVQATKECYMWE